MQLFMTYVETNMYRQEEVVVKTKNSLIALKQSIDSDHNSAAGRIHKTNV